MGKKEAIRAMLDEKRIVTNDGSQLIWDYSEGLFFLNDSIANVNNLKGDSFKIYVPPKEDGNEVAVGI